jgi:hypothetical protein
MSSDYRFRELKNDATGAYCAIAIVYIFVISVFRNFDFQLQRQYLSILLKAISGQQSGNFNTLDAMTFGKVYPIEQSVLRRSFSVFDLLKDAKPTLALPCVATTQRET